MLEKNYKILELSNGKKDITILINNINHSEVLTSFLYSDVTPFEDWIKADFDRVISGESEYEEVNGNVCSAEIGPVTTKIYDNLIEDDEEYYASCCEVDTKELRQLIDEWCEKVREFKKEHRN